MPRKIPSPKQAAPPAPALTCAIYARVSTTDQNCDLQLRELRDYCRRRGWRIAGEYVDTGFSGVRVSRPALDRLMREAQQHRFDAVVVWKLDRFGRSVGNMAEAIRSLRSWGVRFIVTSQSIDTDASNPSSNLLLWILAAIAEFERELARERVIAGMRAAKARGKCLGRPKRVFDRRQACDLRRAGRSVREIARALKVGRTTIHRLLGTDLGTDLRVSHKGVASRARK